MKVFFLEEHARISYSIVTFGEQEVFTDTIVGGEEGTEQGKKRMVQNMLKKQHA